MKKLKRPKIVKNVSSFLLDEARFNFLSLVTNMIFNVVDFCLLPSLCCGEPNYPYNEELWSILSRVPYQGIAFY